MLDTAINQFFGSDLKTIQQQVEFCGHLLFGNSFSLTNFTYSDSSKNEGSGKKAEMRYNSIYFSYQNIIQIVLVQCKAGGGPDPEPPVGFNGGDNSFRKETNNLFIKRC